MTWNPASISANASEPMATINEQPMAESYEYRPPTQSQNPNVLAASIPNSVTACSLVDTATKCLATASVPAPTPSSTHCLAAAALVSVSRVVNVFELITNRVDAGSRSLVLLARSTGSMLD